MNKEYTFFDLDSMMLMGLDTHGNLCFVDDVPNGLDCNLTCPFCGSRFNAKNRGEVKAHHFAHESGADCKQGHESVLPYFIKSIIDEVKKITLPRGYIYLNGEPLNDSQVASIKECSIIKCERDKVGLVEITTLKNKRICIVVYINKQESIIRKQYALSNYENVIEVDLSSYKKQDVSVIHTLKDILVEGSYHINWIKRFDEEKIELKINELALKRNELFESDDYFSIYCPIAKRKIPSRKCECHFCNASLSQMVRKNNHYSEGCLGYIPRPHTVEKLFSSSKINMNEVFENLRLAKYGTKIGGVIYYTPREIKQILRPGQKAKIFNAVLNKTFLFDGTFEIGQPVGYEINSITGEISDKKSFLPITFMDKWAILD